MFVASYPPRRNTNRKRGPVAAAAYSRTLMPAAPVNISCRQRRRVSRSLIVHLRRGQQKGIPFLRRVRLAERSARSGAQEGFDPFVIQAVRQLRKAARGRGTTVLRVEQVHVAGTDGARDLEAPAHLPGALPTGSDKRVTVRRLAAEGRFTE